MEFVIETGYSYKNNTVTMKHRNVATLNRMIDNVQRNTKVDVESLKARLDGWSVKMVQGTLSDDERGMWCVGVAMLTFLKAIPCDDANGTMTIIPSDPTIVFEDLETQSASVRMALLEKIQM